MVARAANESWPGNVFDALRLDRPANNSDERREGRRGIVTRKNADSLSFSLSLSLSLRDISFQLNILRFIYPYRR